MICNDDVWLSLDTNCPCWIAQNFYGFRTFDFVFPEWFCFVNDRFECRKIFKFLILDETTDRWGCSSVVERPLRMREARGSNPRISNRYSVLLAKQLFSLSKNNKVLLLKSLYLKCYENFFQTFTNSHVGLYHCKTLPQNKEEKFFSH